jgi:hypothetical protein
MLGDIGKVARRLETRMRDYLSEADVRTVLRDR